MVDISGPPASATRNKPIVAKLKTLLLKAGEAAGVDAIVITSGGQPGTTGRSVGSHRHDGGNAADFHFVKNGRTLNFTRADDLAIFVEFVKAAAAGGATGIGAGVGYMGPETIHVGYGDVAVWGEGGKSVNAPNWLRQAFAAGRQQGSATPAGGGRAAPVQPPPQPDPPQVNEKRHFVIARDGVKLRSRPENDSDVFRTLPAGTELIVVATEGEGDAWSLVDLEGDGLVDGYVFSSFLTPADIAEDEEEDHAVA